MVRESNMPAVLIGNLFVDVVADADRLKQAAVLDAIIEGHVQGISAYLGLTKTKADKPVIQERDIKVPSKLAETTWKEVTEKGFFDGTRPGAAVTREELGTVVGRLLKYFDQRG